MVNFSNFGKILKRNLWGRTRRRCTASFIMIRCMGLGLKLGEPMIGEEVGGREQELGPWPFGVLSIYRDFI